MEKWQILTKVVFYILIPGIILYYRFRKKFRTAFALGMALTSIFVGFLVSQSFRESYQDAFVRLMNQDGMKRLAWAQRCFSEIPRRSEDKSE